MRSNSGQTRSIWMATAPAPSLNGLKENIHTDVCVVGAGIAGLSTAYMLAREGRSVAVLEDGHIGSGETERTTAHLSNALDDRYYELERLFGRQGARLAADSHTAAIDRIESIVTLERIECDFERLDGYLFVPPDCSTEELDCELSAARRAGLAGVEFVDRAPIEHFNTGRCLRFPRQAQFHPTKYLAGLAEAITRDGGLIYTNAHAEEIRGGSPACVKTSGGATVTADAVVVATNSPVNDPLIMHTKQGAYRTYVIGARVPKGSVAKVLLWDTLDPYHYVRVSETEAWEVLIVGGEDHKTGEENDGQERFAYLEEWTRERFPVIERVEFRWSGQILEPVDSLAFIGRKPQDESNVFIATGDSGHGMTHGTIAGILLADLINGRDNEWARLYDPSRLSYNSLLDFAGENVNALSHYTDYFAEGDVASSAEIKPGEGAIMRCGIARVAVFRDENGVIHQLQAICQHLGCAVAWNPTEKTWDCPCHGSRYDSYGGVINGPSISDLKRAGKQQE